ncbi:head protein [Lactobacillus reuteri]|jgi:hypothetical protein|uniref:Head protein n=1 Tax=Limosilactobacillus reuteri TaxID=1598 RepID=A0A6L5P2J4_LIMRT|nr:YjcQ family protein [Limosilactobacillus reuteri]MRH08478.1 head protein [Limosilactobacillus reuteri]MRH08528.1 head protein [Limosilactobacillus reuteri]
MSNNDFFTVAYKVLSYLKWCYENGKSPDVDILNADTFNISKVQFGNTLKMLKDHGYIDGVSITRTLNGTLVIAISNASITVEGLQYLAENSMMKKAYNVLKEVKDWLPGF